VRGADARARGQVRGDGLEGGSDDEFVVRAGSNRQVRGWPGREVQAVQDRPHGLGVADRRQNAHASATGGEAVASIAIAGNVRDLLGAVAAVGDDLKLMSGGNRTSTVLLVGLSVSGEGQSGS
jgi:hypothetical protein